MCYSTRAVVSMQLDHTGRSRYFCARGITLFLERERRSIHLETRFEPFTHKRICGWLNNVRLTPIVTVVTTNYFIFSFYVHVY